ncbi:MAG: hypothetical protein J6X24_04425 [Firmicutes bacterium]|nr:hypothetical protein [Bacillota bacterium]
MARKENKTAYRSAMPSVRDMPESDRPREKMLAQGVRALSNTALLAVLIASGTGSDSAISLAAKVLA